MKLSTNYWILLSFWIVIEFSMISNQFSNLDNISNSFKLKEEIYINIHTHIHTYIHTYIFEYYIHYMLLHNLRTWTGYDFINVYRTLTRKLHDDSDLGLDFTQGILTNEATAHISGAAPLSLQRRNCLWKIWFCNNVVSPALLAATLQESQQRTSLCLIWHSTCDG